MPTTRKRVESQVPSKYESFLERLRNFCTALAAVQDLKLVAKITLKAMIELIGVEGASLFFLHGEEEEYFLLESILPQGTTDFPRSFGKENPVFRYFLKERTLIFREKFTAVDGNPEWPDMLKSMDRWKAFCVLPLHSNGRLIGIVTLGQKSEGQTYTPEDRDLVSIFGNLSASALENRKLIEDLKRLTSHIERVDRLASLGTLTAALAHELRNPVAAIKVFTQLLPERFDDPEFRNDFLQIVSAEVDRISTLLKELLEFARPSSPRMEAANIHTIIESTLLLVSTEAKKKRIRIFRDTSKDLPLVPVDPEQIKQVLLNVLINAIEATEEEGKILVKTRPCIKSNGQTYIQVVVTDTGCGISHDSLDSIFRPFFTTKQNGSGLGLSISRQIIQNHKGTIDVESEPNKGTTFYINLPLHPESLL